MIDLCEECVLYGRCNGECGDTNPNYYEEQEQNDNYDYIEAEGE